jgi:pimeloyl-ACP methyl ester carboxylesterase
MYLDVNETTLYFEKFGCEQPPLILLHGNGESHEIFNELVPLLTDRYTVYAIDSREHGQSERNYPLLELHYTDMAEDIAQFIQKLKLDKPTICGFSDGAILTLMLGYTYPELCGKLVICGANANPKGLKKSVLLKMKAEYMIHRDAKFKMMLTEPHIFRKDLQRIQSEVTVLAGEKDMIRRHHTEAIAAVIPHSDLHILSGEDHCSYVVHNTKLAEFL